MKRLFFLSVTFLMAVSIGAAPGEPLSIPPLDEGVLAPDGTRVFSLTVQQGAVEFFPDVATPTLGYNGDYLGPTLRLRQGEDVSIRVLNRLSEATTTHWHGAHLPAAADGGPHQRIEPGREWRAEFTVDQPAATLWYHPHLIGTTAEQVYKGLAGLIIIEDPDAGVSLPDRYGIDDIPLIFQERRFERNGSFRYRPGGPDIMHGYGGNQMLVNGAVSPTLETGEELVRLRLLNGSNSTILRLTLKGREGDGDFLQIASDGGLLSTPVRTNQIILSPGERAEVLLSLADRGGDSFAIMAETNLGAAYRALTISPAQRLRPNGEVPRRLATLPAPQVPRGASERRFVMSTMGPGGRLTINGKQMNLARVDERVRLDTTEVWEVSTAGMMMNTPHSFHVHGLQFRIISLNGTPPPATLAGYKDTVLLWPGDRVRLLLSFEDYTGLYMYHCHLLEHEDAGMMGQYEVIAPQAFSAGRRPRKVPE